MYLMRCSNCLQAAHIGYVHVSLATELPHYCPYCGEKQTLLPTKIDSYWFDLAESLGFERSQGSADLTQKLYRLWDTEKYRHFRDFVESFAEPEEEEEEEEI